MYAMQWSVFCEMIVRESNFFETFMYSFRVCLFRN